MKPRTRRPRRTMEGPKLEKVIHAEVSKAARTLGFDVNDMSQPRASMMPVGLPDLYLRHPRWQVRCWVEVKRPGEEPRKTQRAWHKVEREAGGYVLTVTSVAELVLGLKAIGAPIR